MNPQQLVIEGIDVQPESEYQTEEYSENESQFIQDFISIFPNKGILFTCNNPNIKLPNIIYEKSKC